MGVPHAHDTGSARDGEDVATGVARGAENGAGARREGGGGALVASRVEPRLRLVELQLAGSDGALRLSGRLRNILSGSLFLGAGLGLGLMRKA